MIGFRYGTGKADIKIGKMKQQNNKITRVEILDYLPNNKGNDIVINVPIGYKMVQSLINNGTILRIEIIPSEYLRK